MRWIRVRLLAVARGFALGGFALVGGAVIGLPVFAILSGISWIGALTFPTLCVVAITARGLATIRRKLAVDWSGVDIPRPYGAKPELQKVTHGWYWTGHDYHRRRWIAVYSLYVGWAERDPATWRDMAWLICEPIVGAVQSLLPTALVGYGLLTVMAPWTDLPWYAGASVTAAFAIPLGIAIGALGLAIAPTLLNLHAHWSRVLLRPTRVSWLTRRVQRLTETRTAATVAQAAELRRIERDLHDGVQARLVAMGLKLGAVEALIDRDPEAAKALVAQTRENSAQALGELRALVRGIHPPVLAERGLPDAIRALALDAPLPVLVIVEVPGRVEPPIEATIYFAVAESLTNIVKHAGAHRASIELAHRGGLLRVTVTDDGHGGARLDAGSGLVGIAQRLGTFDGSLAVDSPLGGPTVLAMELPCTLTAS